MPLVLELGSIRDDATRRALEQIILQLPGLVTVTGGGGGGPETDPVASPALATHAALTTGAHGGIVASSDARLTDARTPTAHATTHQPGGSDAMAVDAVAATGSLRTLGATATSAAAGNRGMPTGGTAAQVLKKNSGTDYDASWAASGGVSPWTAVVTQAADVTVATTTNTNTDLVFTFEANSTYIIDLYLMTTSVATTTGVAFAWDTSVAVTNANLTFEHQLAAAGTLTGGDAIADDTVRGLSSGVPDTATTPIIGMGILRSTTNAGTCRLRFRPEVAASATFKAGSTMRVMKAVASGSPLVDPGTWAAFPFDAGYSNVGAGYACRYRKDSSGVVWMEGLMQRSSLIANDTWTAVGTMPTGYRPIPTQSNWATTVYKNTGYGAGLLQVEATGVVSVFMPAANIAAGGYWALNPISYLAA